MVRVNSMKTIILPGYSPKNRDWAVKVKKNLKKNGGIVVHEWRHWKSGSFYLPHEVKVLTDSIRDEKVNLLCKSVGTRVAMELISDLKDQINKVILCGIPTRFESDKTRNLYTKGLTHLSAEQVLCFQNKQDPFSPYDIIKKFIHSVNPKIKIISKERNDHHYPYYEDFRKFIA